MNRNPLVEQPRSQPAQIIPPRHESTLLNWLENSGRMIVHADQSEPKYLLDVEDPEISGLIDVDGVDDDDLELLGDDEE